MPIRVAGTQDAEAIAAVINSAFRHAESFFIQGDRIDLETVRTLLQTGRFLVADDHGLLYGCVYVESRGDRTYLGLLSIDPQHQRSGIGSKLMDAAEDYCAKAGSHFMDLRMVNVRKELPRFYHRRGYVEIGTEPFTPGLNPKLPCHFVKMSKPLTRTQLKTQGNTASASVSGNEAPG